MTAPAPGVRFGLSARLLWLTVFFVMVAEVLIWAPSVARFRQDWLQERITRAHLATIAYAALPDDAPLLMGIGQKLLEQTDLRGIVLKRGGRSALMVTDDMPPAVDATFDLRQEMFFGWVGEAFATLAGDGRRILRVLGTPPHAPDVRIEIILDESALRRDMLAFSARILTLSIVISLITAGLVYVSLHRLLVRPMRHITQSMVAFRADPEGAAVAAPDLIARTDEIGIAERELATMQDELRAALAQKTRLATLGAAVAKINHDLRNTLATAMLVSDRLADSGDPEVRKVAPRLYDAMQRAVSLCSRTLNFVSDTRPAPAREAVPLRALLDGVAAELAPAAEAARIEGTAEAARITVAADPAEAVAADREQLHRALINLVLNALQAGARVVSLDARIDDGRARIRVADDGAGLEPKAREKLFQPFVGSARRGGAGLGLPIAREIARDHGGDLALVETGPAGTIFEMTLPAAVG